jgi:hypothetical protein
MCEVIGENKKKKWWEFEIESLKTVEQPKDFWMVKIEDAVPCFLMFLISAFIWIVTILSSDFFAPMSYWDGPNYLYASMTLYNVPENNPWTVYLSFPQYYLACHLPGYPLAIRLISTFFWNFSLAGYSVAIFLIPVLFVYVFRRLLVLYNCVRCPEWTATLISILPIRFMIYHSVGASEPLFMLFTALSLIFFKLGKTPLMCLCVSACLITRVEGLIVWGTLGLCCLLNFDIKKAFCVGLCLISSGALILFHYLKFGYWDAYLKFNQGNQNILLKIPFDELITHSRSWGNDVMYVSVIYLFIPFVVSVLCCYTSCVPYAIQGTAYIIFVSLLFHLDLMRYSIPGIAPALLIGLDPLFSSKAFRSTAIVSLMIIIIIGVSYSALQIASNRAPYFFFEEIIKSKIHYF